MDPFRPRYHGKDQRLLPVHQVATVELGGNANSEFQIPHGPVGHLGIGHGVDEVAAHANEDLGSSRQHCLD
ncbi:hypothetical protein D3C78_1724020 [compost metagenome]